MRAQRGALANGYSEHIFEQCEGTPLLEPSSSARTCGCLNHVQSNISRIITMRLAHPLSSPSMQDRRDLDAARVSAADSQKKETVLQKESNACQSRQVGGALSSQAAHELPGL